MKNVNFELTRLEGIGIGQNILSTSDSTAQVELKLNSGTTSFQFERNGNWDTLRISATVTGLYKSKRCGYTQSTNIDSFQTSAGIDSVRQSGSIYYHDPVYHPLVKVFLK